MRFPETCLDLQPLSVIENIGFPPFLVPREWTRTFGVKVLCLHWTFQLSRQHRPISAKVLPFATSQMTSSWRRELHLLTASQLFQRKGSRGGNGRRIHFMSLCIFKHKSWHCCNYHHFLHWPQWAATKPAALSVVLHHFIFTVLLWGLADLEWKSSFQSYSPACSLLNQIIKDFLNSEWLVIDWLYSFSTVLVMWKADAKSWGPFLCPEWGIRSDPQAGT